MFIGDAGGFPNRITGEGLYDAFKSAYNAKRAIVEHKSFNDTNSDIFAKMKAQDSLFWVCQYFFLSETVSLGITPSSPVQVAFRHKDET